MRIIFVVLPLLCSCTAFHASKSRLDANEAWWLAYDSNYRGALVVPSGSPVKYCPEPPPDSATNLVSKASANVAKNPVGNMDGSFEFNKSIVDLAKRTTTVEVLRYALFSLCIAEINGTLSGGERTKMTETIMDTVKAIGQAELKQSIKDLVESTTAAKKAQVSDTTLQKITSTPVSQ